MIIKIENIKPPIDPTPNENQKGSLCPKIIKGINPKIVEIIVKSMGTILLLKDFKYNFNFDM